MLSLTAAHIRKIPLLTFLALSSACLDGGDSQLDVVEGPSESTDDNLIDGRATYLRPEVGRLNINGKLCTGTLVSNNAVLTAASCINWTSKMQQGSYGTFTIEKNENETFVYTVERARSFGDGSTSRD